MRALPEDFDAAVVTAIDERLDAIAASGVALPLAIESGSRAWGFPSPDSDYDCRFLYVRPRHAYLSLWPMGDVIETPLDGLLDVNGWDVAKALRLAARGNAVVIEWLRSPVVYRGDPEFRDLLAGFCKEHAPVERVRSHYLHLAISQRIGAPQAVKKLLYLLRPVMALRWMRMYATLPPMHFPTLVDACALPAALRGEIDELLRRKAVTRELGTAPVAPALLAFADDEIAIAQQVTRPGGEPSATAMRAADVAFCEVLGRFAPEGGHDGKA